MSAWKSSLATLRAEPSHLTTNLLFSPLHVGFLPILPTVGDLCKNFIVSDDSIGAVAVALYAGTRMEGNKPKVVYPIVEASNVFAEDKAVEKMQQEIESIGYFSLDADNCIIGPVLSFLSDRRPGLASLGLQRFDPVLSQDYAAAIEGQAENNWFKCIDPARRYKGVWQPAWEVLRSAPNGRVLRVLFHDEWRRCRGLS